MRRLLVPLVGLAACTHQQDASTLPVGKAVSLETVDGASIAATVVPHPTEIVFHGPDGRPVDSHRIRRIVSIERGRGAWEGFLGGALTGLLVGAVVGLSDGDDRCDDFCILEFSAEEKAAMVGVVGAGIGGAIGIVLGAAIGSRDVYTFGMSRELRFSPQGPPGSVAGATLRF